MNYIVRGKYVLTDSTEEEDGILKEAAVCIQGNEIVEIDDYKLLKNKYPDYEVVGNGKQLLMPGLIDAHSHGSGLTHLQRGLSYDFLENCLIDWAYGIQIDHKLNSKLCALRHLRKGSTTIHHNDLGNVLAADAVENAENKIIGYNETGIRIIYSQGFRNKNILAYDDKEFYKTLPTELQKVVKDLVFFDKEASVDEYFDFFDYIYTNFNDKENAKVILGPSWIHGSTEELLNRTKKKADELGKLPIHIHTLQTPHQKAYGLKKHGKSLLKYLDDLNLVDENLVCGHAVFVTDEDIKLLAEKNASVTHHPSCNFAVRNGISPVVPMLNNGVNVALGIDNKGINDDEDIFMEMRMIYYLHRVAGFNLAETPVLDEFDILNMATVNAARVCGLEGEVGKLKPGMKADMILVDLDEILNQPWSAPEVNIAKFLITRGKGDHVNTVIVDGDLIVQDHEFVNIDVNAIYEEVRAEAEKGLSSEQKEYADKLAKIKPYYHDWYDGWVEDLDFEPYYMMNSKE